MNPILTSILIIFITLTASIGSTIAFYAASQTSSDNFFGATELDLKIQDNNET